jgi:hypothetical protein
MIALAVTASVLLAGVVGLACAQLLLGSGPRGWD